MEPPLTPDSPMIALAYRCLQRDYHALLARQPGPGAAPSSADVHQIRIATRRLRVALRLFGTMLPVKTAARLRKELRWLARGLSDVRDLDVHNKALRQHIRQSGNDVVEGLGGYELALQRERAAARDELKSLFTSARYEQVIASLGALLDGAPSSAALRRWRTFTVRKGAVKYLKHTRRRVLKLGRKIDDDTGVEELHRLRIRAKRLRYALEFFANVYPRLLPAAEGTKALQDVLGEQQDARTARRRVLAYTRTLRAQGEDKEHAAPAALRTWRAAQTQRATHAREQLADEWQRFLETLASTELTAR
jgi:CHAD domain-containing protein